MPPNILILIAFVLLISASDATLPVINAGEIHYSRIPEQYWQNRISMAKSMGLNALSIYIMWNHHQTAKGQFDYHSYGKNLTLFLQIATKYSMYILIRPGPYVCAEWDLGGMPARLLAEPNMQLRTNNAPFLNQVQIYFASLVPILRPFLPQNKGNIIMLQVENQYGFYGTDKTYMEAIRRIWNNLNLSCDQYYVDSIENIEISHWQGANIGVNNAASPEQYQFVKEFEPTGFIFGGEIYSGWLTHWGEAAQGKSMERYMREFTYLLQSGTSFSMYMFHGGTNFALTAGANAYRNLPYDYAGHITSYDYEAPLNEQGQPTDKYYAFRNQTLKYAKWVIPSVPTPIPAMNIPAFTPTQYATLLDCLPEPSFKDVSTHYVFESKELKMFNQGMVLYETTMKLGTHTVKLIVHDYGLLYVDGECIRTMDRNASTAHSFQIICNRTSCKVSVLVQAMGHINFDHQMGTDFKGLIQFSDGKGTAFLWTIYSLPIASPSSCTKLTSGAYPVFSKSILTLNQTDDTYLDMHSYWKGYVWVNGFNLGRYWSVGPYLRLYCPGVWLKKGENTIVVLQLISAKTHPITGEKTIQTIRKSTPQTFSQEELIQEE